MQQTIRMHTGIVAFWALAAMLAWSTDAGAQIARGEARSVHATVKGLLGTTTTTLADTGTLNGPADARENSQTIGAVPGLLSGSTLHASTIGWPDRVASEASIADLSVSVGGSSIGADFVMSRAIVISNEAGTGVASIDGLSINGLPIIVTGQPNQTVAVPGGRVVINEQQASSHSRVVNALHIIIDGVADVVVASSTAAFQ